MLEKYCDGFTIEDLLTDINIELEHGLITPNTNITNGNLINVAKIALAHLNEFTIKSIAYPHLRRC